MYSAMLWEVQVPSSLQPHHGQQCPETPSQSRQAQGSDVRDLFGLWTTCHLCWPPIFNAKVDEDSKGAPEKAGCSR